MTRFNPKVRTVFSLTAAAALLSGCLLGPDYKRPALPTPPAFDNDFELQQTGEAFWWRGFQDPTLNALVETALKRNIEIASAIRQFEALNAGVRAAQSDLFPSIDAQVNRNQNFTSDDGEGRLDDAGNPFIRSRGIAQLVFTPDFFGRSRRAVQRARANRNEQAYAILDLRRLTASNVAQRYVEVRRSRARLALLEESLELQRQTLEIVRARRSAGLAAGLDVSRAEADLASTRAQRGRLMVSEAEAIYDLTVLLGRTPGEEVLDPSTSTIPSFIAGPPIGVPADLIRRRPDILQAEQNLIAATASIGIEAADLYPSFRVPGDLSVDLEGPGIGDAVVATVTSRIDIPLFDAGRRRAEIRAAASRAEAAKLDYRQTLLEAMRDVETALIGIEAAALRRDELAAAVKASEAAYRQLNALYKEGLSNLTDILDAQRQLISNREAYVDSEADLAVAVISLYLAVGSPTGQPYVEEDTIDKPARRNLYRTVRAALGVPTAADVAEVTGDETADDLDDAVEDETPSESDPAQTPSDLD